MCGMMRMMHLETVHMKHVLVPHNVRLMAHMYIHIRIHTCIHIHLLNTHTYPHMVIILDFIAL